MEDSTHSSAAKNGLPLILLAAVVQGWALYWLHHAIKNHHWPATDQAWLIAFYALAVFVPVTLQLLAEHARAAALWRLVAILAVAYFGFGWHLGASVSAGGTDRFAETQKQILNVLKWLGLLAGAILTCFTIALLFSLPGLVFTGHKAIGASWLLWLIAVTVLLLNAAFRDGSVSRPYPKWIAQFIRVVVPLTVIISLTALYSLLMRSQHYGLTVERVWAFVVAGAALLYSIGYSISAFGKGARLGGIARVNVIVAVALIAIIAAALTPLLSPYRLAANSQFRLVLANGPEASEDSGRPRSAYVGLTPLQYLHFDSGKYGRAKLEELARVRTGLGAERIRLLAQEELARKERWESRPAGCSVRGGLPEECCATVHQRLVETCSCIGFAARL